MFALTFLQNLKPVYHRTLGNRLDWRIEMEPQLYPIVQDPALDYIDVCEGKSLFLFGPTLQKRAFTARAATTRRRYFTLLPRYQVLVTITEYNNEADIVLDVVQCRNL